jgi:hypothetical protein
VEIRDQLFSGEGLSSRALAQARGLKALAELLGNPFEPAVIDRIDVDIRVEYRNDVAEIVAAALPDERVRPGETLPVRVVLRPYAGKEFVEVVPVVVPRALAGKTIKIDVASGALVRPDVPKPESLRGLMDNLRASYPGQSIVVSLSTPDSGVSSARPADSRPARFGARHASLCQPDPPRRRVSRSGANPASLRSPGEREAGTDRKGASHGQPVATREIRGRRTNRVADSVSRGCGQERVRGRCARGGSRAARGGRLALGILQRAVATSRRAAAACADGGPARA